MHAIVESTHSSPVVQEQPGNGLVTPFTRPVEGSLLIIVESIYRSLTVYEQLGNTFVTI